MELKLLSLFIFFFPLSFARSVSINLYWVRISFSKGKIVPIQERMGMVLATVAPSRPSVTIGPKMTLKYSFQLLHQELPHSAKLQVSCLAKQNRRML